METIARNLAASRIDAYLRGRLRPAVGKPGKAATAVLPAIAISRAAGVPATEIAARVSRILDFGVFDREVLKAIADESHLGDRIIEALDEGRRSALDSWITGFLRYDQPIIDPGGYHHILCRVIRGIALHGSAIIIGRGSPFILKGTEAFRVRLVAPLGLRALRLASPEGGKLPLPLERARAEVVRLDRERHLFIRKHFGAEIGDPSHYDAVFNLRSLDPDLAAELIVETYRRTLAAGIGKASRV